MRKENKLLHDQSAVAEEFTALPTLSVIMIGFTIFFILIAQAYQAYEQHQTRFEYIEKAKYLSNKLISPTTPFIQTGGLLNPNVLNSSIGRAYITSLQETLSLSSINFSIAIRYDENIMYIPDSPSHLANDRFGYSSYQPLIIDSFHIRPGILTVIVWGET
jgi:hypothetical protein